MRRKVLFALLMTAICGYGFAQDLSKTPWLKGVTISPYLSEPSPTLKMNIYGDNGESIPATLTEDIPVLVTSESSIFDDEAPQSAETPNAYWVSPPIVSWFFVDWETNKNTPASVTAGVAPNQRYILPRNPTGRGAVTCNVGRRMKYDTQDGKSKTTYANSSKGSTCRVFEISASSGRSGTCWPVENPPDEYPLPKHADVYFSGSIFGSDDITAEGLELGDNMMIDSSTVALNITKRDILTVKIIGSDNYKLDTTKLKFGISEGPNTPSICHENAEKIEISKLRLPEKAFLFLEAVDMAGNKQAMYIPIKVRR